MQKKKSIKSRATFDTALEELQQLLARLEAGHVSIDTLPSEIKRAQLLINGCRLALRDTEVSLKAFEDSLSGTKDGAE